MSDDNARRGFGAFLGVGDFVIHAKTAHNGITKEEAEKMIKQWREAWPEIASFLDLVKVESVATEPNDAAKDEP